MFSRETFKQASNARGWEKAPIAAANHSLTKETWSSYNTAVKNLRKCSREMGMAMDFPLDNEKTLVFVGWLLDRDLAPATISTYLAGIRQAHLAAGIFINTLRSPIINQIIQGAINLRAIKKREREKPTRLPVTPTVLKLIKAELKISDLEKKDKLLVWSVCTLAFMGAFRIHELLAKREGVYDPNFTLLGRDVKVKKVKVGKEEVKSMTILLKSEKKDRVGKSTVVDVYQSGGELCPVKAFEKWKKNTNFASSMPAFRLTSGKPLTGKNLNKILEGLLGKHLDYKRGKISSHSFRSGMASLMGSLGYTEDQIQAVGQWSSQAYQNI